MINTTKHLLNAMKKKLFKLTQYRTSRIERRFCLIFLETTIISLQPKIEKNQKAIKNNMVFNLQKESKNSLIAN